VWKKITSFPLRGVEQKLRSHMQLVLDSVGLLVDLLDACEAYDWETIGVIAERIAGIERHADNVKREIDIGLYSGVLFVGLKEDFLKLMEAIDDIADKAKDASRVIATRHLSRDEMNVLFGRPELRKMVAGTVELVKLLERSIVLMDKNTKAALACAQEVEKREEELDELKMFLIIHLSERENRELAPLSFLQLRDFIFQLDEVADKAEAASDVVTAMIIKSGA